MAFTVTDAAKTTGMVLCPAYACYKVAGYAKENPEKAKNVAKTAAKIATFPLLGVYKASQKAYNYFKN